MHKNIVARASGIGGRGMEDKGDGWDRPVKRKRSKRIRIVPCDKYSGRIGKAGDRVRGSTTISAHKSCSETMESTSAIPDGPSDQIKPTTAVLDGQNDQIEPTTAAIQCKLIPNPQYHQGVFSDNSAAWYRDEMASREGSIVRRKHEQPDETWQLASSVDGGPEDPSVLSGFGGHIAYFIWTGQDRDVLMGHSRYNRLKKWPHMSKTDSVKLLLGLGFSNLVSCIYKHIDMPLVSAFVERWHPETNSFHLPFGEMTITLHDVRYLLGIPVEGHAVVVDPSVEDLHSELATLLGMTLHEVKDSCKSGSIKFKVLEERSIGEGVSPEAYAKVYILWLLGSTLFVDKTGNSAPANYLPLLAKLDKIGQYAWGTAALANMDRQLGVASHKDCKQIAGCLSLVQAWIYEHFPYFRPDQNPKWTNKFPYACRWLPKKVRSRSNTLHHYRQFLDGLKSNNVNFMPYGFENVDNVPISKFHGIIHCRNIAEPYMPDRVMRQFGYVQFIPSSPLPPLKVQRPTKPLQYLSDHPPNTIYWKNWSEHVVDLDQRSIRCSTPDQVQGKYMSWFLKISHPRITPSGTSFDQQERPPHELDSSRG